MMINFVVNAKMSWKKRISVLITNFGKIGDEIFLNFESL